MKPKQTPRQVRDALRRQEAVALRAKGHTYDYICQVLHYASRGAAFNAISTELDKTRQEAVETLRRIQHLRVEAIIQTLYPLCISGPNTLLKLDCIKTFLLLSRYLSRLLGLDIDRRQAGEAGGKAAASATANIIYIQLGKGEPVKTLQDLSDSELLALVAGESGGAEKEAPQGQQEAKA